LNLSGTDSGNYLLAQANGLTANVTPAALAITADNQDKRYGESVAFGSGSTQFTSSGLQNAETIASVTLNCPGGDPTAGAAGSPYPITPSAATGGTFAAENYTITYLAGTLTVAPADQTITFDPLPAMTVGDPPFNLSAVASSGLAVAYVSSEPAVASVDGSTVTLLQAGATTITASQAGDGNFHAATPVPQPLTVTAPPLPPFTAWALDPAQGLTPGVNDGPLDDPDHDGVVNLIEFVLRGAPMLASQAGLPVLRRSGGQWTFEYDRNGQSVTPATTQVVEYGGILSQWTPVAIPASSAGTVTITPGSPSDHVSVSIPDLGGKVFVRLKVTQ